MREILKKYNLSLTQIAKELDIPYRSLQNWNLGLREPPAYVLKLMDFYFSQKK
jgi:DNA-binding transcriptional regulator YiaG